MTYLECICQKLVLSDVKRSCFTTANALSSKNSHKNAILSKNSIKRAAESGYIFYWFLSAGLSRVSNFFCIFCWGVVGCHCGNFPCHKGIHLPFLAINDWHFCLRTYYRVKNSKSEQKTNLQAYSSLWNYLGHSPNLLQ